MSQRQPIVLCGTGAAVRIAAELLPEIGQPVAAVLDCPDGSPELRKLSLVCFQGEESNAHLRELGWKRILTLQELLNLPDTPDPGDRKEWHWQRPWRQTAAHRAELEATENLLADTASKELLRHFLECRRTGCGKVEPDPGQPYFAIAPPGATERNLVDCGAGCGEHLEPTLRLVPKLGSVLALEPDPERFSSLNRTLEYHRRELPSAALPCAAGPTTDDRSAVLTVALDGLIYPKPVNYLKLNVGGAELPALRGAEQLISRNRPVIAVAVYHRCNDLWELPLYLQQLAVRYEFVLRCHGRNFRHTVLYAIPR